MNSDLNEKTSITLPKSVWLVVFELLATSSDQWRKANINDASSPPLHIAATNNGERAALWSLEGAIEATLPELFAANYRELVEISKGLLSESN